MADILLAVLVLASFAFGYYVTDRFGSYLDRHLRADPEAPPTDGRICITRTEGKSAGEVSKEVHALLDTLPEHEAYEITICRKSGAAAAAYPERSGETIPFDPRE